MSAQRILVFPHAGGTRSAFARVHPALHVLEYPGHGADMDGEPLLSAEGLVSWANDRCRGELAWFGHSLGAYVAVLLLAQRQRRGLSLPRTLYLSASLPPAALRSRLATMDLSGPSLLRQLVDSGGIAGELAENPEFSAYLLRILQADYGIALQLGEWLSDLAVREALHGIQVVLLSGTSDAIAPSQDVQAWESICEVSAHHRLGGGHFYFLDPVAASSLASVLDADLRAAAAHV